MIAAPNSEDSPALGQDVRRREVLGESQRVPHWRDVEPAADVESLGHVSQVDCKHEEVGDALVALRLKVVLGHPERVEAQPVQGLGYRLRLVVRGHQVVVPEPPVVDRYSAVADVVHIHVTGVQAVKLGNHGSLFPPMLAYRFRLQSTLFCVYGVATWMLRWKLDSYNSHLEKSLCSRLQRR